MPGLSEFYKSRALQLLASGKVTRSSHLLRAAHAKTHAVAADMEAGADAAAEAVASALAPSERNLDGTV